MTNKEWDNFVDDMQDYMNFDISDLKTGGRTFPPTMPDRKPIETPKYNI